MFKEKSYYDTNFVRLPFVSGQFYPSEPGQLRTMIEDFLGNATPESPKGRLLALISPHAGYVYSGQVAAYSYKLLKDEKINSVILIGSSHRYPLRGASVWPRGVYKTPLGEVKINEDMAERILNASKGVKFEKQAHLIEHSLEVQIPFLQCVLKDFSIVPILTNRLDNDELDEISQVLSSCLSTPGVIIIASTDLSHYHPYEEAKIIDAKTLDVILDGDPKKMNKTSHKGDVELCGEMAVTLLLEAVKKLDTSPKIKLLKYANSGDTSGMKDRVVGYAAVGFSTTKDNVVVGTDDDKPLKQEEKGGNAPDDTLHLTKEEQSKLLKLARESIKGHLTGSKGPKIEITEPELMEPSGAFVTLHKKGALRGCIGYIRAYKPLNETVSDCAVSAAVRDFRFPPVEESELDDIDIEISVLTPLKRIDDINEITVGKHGIYIVRSNYSGLLLPQVATEYGWDRLTFLAQTCRKAGLPSDAWKKGAEIYIFSAQIFGEKEE